MLEAVAEIGALPGGVLEQDHRRGAAPRSQQRAQALRRSAAAPPASVPVVYEPGMHHQPEQPERVGAVVFLDERRERLLAQRPAPRRRC